MKFFSVLLGLCLFHGGFARPQPQLDRSPFMTLGGGTLGNWLVPVPNNGMNSNFPTMANAMHIPMTYLPNYQILQNPPVETPYNLMNGLFGSANTPGIIQSAVPATSLDYISSLGSITNGVMGGGSDLVSNLQSSGLFSKLSDMASGLLGSSAQQTVPMGSILGSLGNIATSILPGSAGGLTDVLGTFLGGGLTSSATGALSGGSATQGSILSTIKNGLLTATSPVETPSTTGLLGQAAKLGGDAMKIKVATEANMANAGLGLVDTSVQMGSKLVKDAVGMGTDIGKTALGGSTGLASTAIKGGTDLAKQSLDLINYIPVVGTLMKPVTYPVKGVLGGVQAGSNLALGAATGVGGAALDATKTGTNIGTGLVSGASSLGIGAGKGAINAGAKAVNSIIDRVVGLLPKN